MSRFKRRKYKVKFYKNKRILMYSILGLFLFLGMGYSVLNTGFNIFGNVTVKEYIEPTLYNVLRKEAETNGLAKEYTGSHGDSMDSSLSTEKIYHWYATTDAEGTQILDKNNVIFAGQCWQMIRTTDTGGVKLIYNGEAVNNQCLNTRGNHVGYAQRTTQTLNSNYWYGTDYTYDSTNQVFSITGTTEQTTWSEANASGLIGKYTCRQTTEAGTCATLYLVESYYNTTSGYVIPLNANSHYSQFGGLQYSRSDKSLSYAGYMYGDVYSYNNLHYGSTITFDTKQNLFSSLSCGDSFLYSKTVSFDGTNYILDDPILGSDVPNGDFSGYYTFISDSVTSGSEPYYLVGLSNGAYYHFVKLSSTKPLSSYNILLGDSISDNGDGTYTIDSANSVVVTVDDWYANYANYQEKYTCGDSSATCTNPRYIISTTFTNYAYIKNVEEKIMIGKSRNGLILDDTLLVGKDEWYHNYESYSDYKYTCGDASSTCTESTLRMILNYTSTGYRSVINYYYGSGVTWDGTNYTLVDPIELENYNNVNNLSTHHYMCISKGLKQCDKVAYAYYNEQSYNRIYFITLEDGVTTISKAMENMFTKNTHDSIIKFGVDAWYKHYLLNYDNYIEDTIFCNNRSIIDFAGWDDNGSMVQKTLKFKEYNQDVSDLSCINLTDRFSVSNNNAKLTYKVGLITHSEENLFNSQTARNTGKVYWLLSPDFFNVNYVFNGVVNNGMLGGISGISNASTEGVRPAISLVPGTEYLDGDGTMEKPYFVGEVYNITNNNSMFRVRKKAAPNYEVSITSNDYIVTSFKVNGNLITGDTFIMPSEDVTITDITYIDANYTITNTDNAVIVPSTGRYNTTITLDAPGYTITSFKVNGTLVNGDTFTMPSEDVTITEITKIAQVTVESEHNPYANNIDNVVYYEHTFDGATSLTVELTYQTESTTYDWIYLYDSSGGSPINNKKYGGSTLTTETITVNSNYLKILFRTDSSTNNYYGFKAVITPNYD